MSRRAKRTATVIVGSVTTQESCTKRPKDIPLKSALEGLECSVRTYIDTKFKDWPTERRERLVNEALDSIIRLEIVNNSHQELFSGEGIESSMPDNDSHIVSIGSSKPSSLVSRMIRFHEAQSRATNNELGSSYALLHLAGNDVNTSTHTSTFTDKSASSNKGKHEKPHAEKKAMLEVLSGTQTHCHNKRIIGTEESQDEKEELLPSPIQSRTGNKAGLCGTASYLVDSYKHYSTGEPAVQSFQKRNLSFITERTNDFWAILRFFESK